MTGATQGRLRLAFMGRRISRCRASLRCSRRVMTWAAVYCPAAAAGGTRQQGPTLRRAALRREQGDFSCGIQPDCATQRPRRNSRRWQLDAVVVAAYGLILPKPILNGAAPRLSQRPRLAVATLAGGGADPARHPGRRCRNRRQHHADGGGARTGPILMAESVRLGPATTAVRAARSAGRIGR